MEKEATSVVVTLKEAEDLFWDQLDSSGVTNSMSVSDAQFSACVAIVEGSKEGAKRFASRLREKLCERLRKENSGSAAEGIELSLYELDELDELLTLMEE